MRLVLGFLKTTLLGGIVFLLPVAAAVKCIMQLGVGTQELLEGHQAAEGKTKGEVA